MKPFLFRPLETPPNSPLHPHQRATGAMKSLFPSQNDPNYITFGTIDRVPENVSFLTPNANTKIPLSDLTFKWHPHSHHISIDNFQPQSYYEEYLMTTTYSQIIQDLQRSQMEKLFSLHASSKGPQSFLVIGCGYGSFMNY